MALTDLNGRVVVITGGAGGIGRALGQAFAAHGARIALSDIDEARLATACDQLRQTGATVHGFPVDVTSRAAVTRLATEVVGHFGQVDVVCNNAGIAPFGRLVDTAPADWELTMGINFYGVVHGVEAFTPHLIAGGGGHLVNVASMAGLIGMEWLGVYCASKFAVVGLSEALYRELAPHGIGVSVVCPMMVDTGITTNSHQRIAAARGTDAPPPPLPPDASLVGATISPGRVAEQVVRGVLRGDLYIMTHPEQREILRRRAARLDACSQLNNPGEGDGE
jgi:NAD(P)-dependent dehydrogenase (short-subunit alcohol dehydrogenase family)